MSVIIGICGQKQSGKNTLANLIMERDSSFTEYAFADPVREAAKAFFGWTDEEMSTNKERVDDFWGISPRQALQYIGTEVGRQGFAEKFPLFKEMTNDQIWIRRFDKYFQSLGENKNVVITDVRFMNEAKAIRRYNNSKYCTAMIIGIQRPGYTGDSHGSEIEVPKCIESADLVVKNDEGMLKLEMYTELIYEMIQNKRSND